MPRSPLSLAALASVAVPGLDVYDVLRSPHPDPDFDVVTVVDATGKRWTVRAPVTDAAGAALEAEAGILSALVRAHEAGALTFSVPGPAGSARMSEGGKAVVYREVRGVALALGAVDEDSSIPEAVGAAIAQIHRLPGSIIDDLDLPMYTAEAYRTRRLTELDAAAQTGKLPPRLTERWEAQLENISWWRFDPAVVHGDLGEHHFIMHGDAVAGIVDWVDARVADPADDLAWIIAAAPVDVAQRVFAAYREGRGQMKDNFLLERARLASELALVRWLMHGVRNDNADVVDDAVEMLADLEALVFEDGAES